jgi:putative ABC transport system substrate-binding protein
MFGIHRREFITLLGGAAAPSLPWPRAAYAQQPRKVWRLGVLQPGAPPEPLWETVRTGLRDLGYIEGRDIVFEIRWAEGKHDRLGALAAELIDAKVDAIYAYTTSPALAARGATTTIPIVFSAVGDPVGTGLAASLARPGANATGLSALATEIAPNTSRVAMLWNDTNPSMVIRANESQAAAVKLGVTIESIGVHDPVGVEQAFKAVSDRGATALLILADPFTAAHRKQIVDFAARQALPAIYEIREFVDAGGLICYGPSLLAMHRRVAGYLDKIFKGAKPGDLPVEQPTKFDLVVNIKTANALGLSIPQSLLVRAAGELTKLVRVDTSHRQSRCEQGTDDPALVTAARLKANRGDCERAQPHDQLGPAGCIVTHRKEPPLRQHHDIQVVLRHVDTAKREHGHLHIPSLLMRARALATVRVWKRRPEHQAHSRFDIRGGCGLPVATRAES